jgi:hypothetical protein
MTDLTEEQEARLEAIRQKYDVRIRTILGHMKELLVEAGYQTSEPDDMSGSESTGFRWGLMVYKKGTPEEPDNDDVDITFELNCSEECDGEENGLQFSVTIVSYGGRIIGGLSPYNYTADVWVPRDDDEAIERRFALFEQADAAGIVDLVRRDR